jgi:hypothetical protein
MAMKEHPGTSPQAGPDVLGRDRPKISRAMANKVLDKVRKNHTNWGRGSAADGRLAHRDGASLLLLEHAGIGIAQIVRRAVCGGRVNRVVVRALIG